MKFHFSFVIKLCCTCGQGNVTYKRMGGR